MTPQSQESRCIFPKSHKGKNEPDSRPTSGRCIVGNMRKTAGKRLYYFVDVDLENKKNLAWELTTKVV